LHDGGFAINAAGVATETDTLGVTPVYKITYTLSSDRGTRVSATATIRVTSVVEWNAHVAVGPDHVSVRPERFG